MQRQIINPWQWQDAMGFVQANAIDAPGGLLLCAGQTAMDPDGQPVHAEDMHGQITLVMDNLETVLGQSGYTLADVMQLRYYTTDVDRFLPSTTQSPTVSPMPDAGPRRPCWACSVWHFRNSWSRSRPPQSSNG